MIVCLTQSLSSHFFNIRAARWVIYTLCTMCLTLFLFYMPATQAQLTQNNTKKSELNVVELSAPKSVRTLIEKYLSLPSEPFADETAQAVFFRKIKQEIIELLATEGYFTPTVTLKNDLPDEKILLKVVPGPRTRVAEVTIEFQGELATDTPEHHERMEQLRASWPLTPGKFFQNAVWEEAKAALLASMTGNQHAAARFAKSEVEIDPATASAKLHLVVDSGPVFYFGELHISGLERYDPNLIDSYVFFKKGEPYRREQLLALQATLQNLPQFSSASVSIRADIAQHQAAPVDILLTEARAKRIGIGGGFSSNNGARGEINYRDFNFLDRAWIMSSMLRYEQKRQTFSAKVDTHPREYNIQYGVGARVELTDIENLKTFNQRLGLTASQIQGRTQIQAGLSWQREEKKPAGVPDTVNQALALDVWWRYHSVDDPVHVRRGNVTEMRVGGGSQYILSERDFFRLYGRHQHWWPVGKRDVLFLRAELGQTFASSRDGIPQEYLFRAGGIQSVRGHDFLSLGVREGDAIVGGRVLGTGTLEYVRWFTHNWGGAAFADIGDAADSWQSFDLSLGYGGGIRWRSPAGPLAIDLARRHDTGTLRLHFSIAVAF